MIKHSIEWAARARLVIPAVVLLAALGMAVNEGTYQHTWRTLTRGIVLTDARIEAARTLHAITVMEAAARAAVAADNEGDRQRFEAAAETFRVARQRAFELIAKVDEDGVVSMSTVEKISDAQAQRYRQWMAQGLPAPRTNDGSTAASRDAIAELEREFTSLLTKAAGWQHQARLSIYDALTLSRWAVHGLILLLMTALLLFVRELRRADAQRNQENQRLALQIEERTSHLRDLADHLVTVREDERGRLARDLHDEMGGLLTSMKLELARVRRVHGVPEAALERLASIDARLNDGIAFKRRIIENLRPSSLDQLGLKVALEMLCTDAAALMAVPIETQVQDLHLGADQDLTMFRIVQESLTNIAKYASARKVKVDLVCFPEGAGHTACLTVQDDGRGFDTAAVPYGRHGLLGMQLRVEAHRGSFSVHSELGRGTRLVARLPAPEPSVDLKPTAQPQGTP